MEMTLKPPRNYPLPLVNPMYVFVAGGRINEAVAEEEALQLAHSANSAAASARHGNAGPTAQEIMAQTAAMRQLAAKREGTKAWAVSAEIALRGTRRSDGSPYQRRQEEEDSGGTHCVRPIEVGH